MPLNVNNRAGGSGTIGYNYLINKKGDSHVVAGATPMIVSGKLQGRLPGNHRDAMTVLMIVAIDELMLSVRTESPYKTVEEFVNAARAKPGQLTVGGTGTPQRGPHLRPPVRAGGEDQGEVRAVQLRRRGDRRADGRPHRRRRS